MGAVGVAGVDRKTGKKFRQECIYLVDTERSQSDILSFKVIV